MTAGAALTAAHEIESALFGEQPCHGEAIKRASSGPPSLSEMTEDALGNVRLLCEQLQGIGKRLGAANTRS